MESNNPSGNVSSSTEQPTKQSGLGIASFILAIVSVVGVIFSIGYVGYLDATEPARLETETSMMMVGFGILFFLLLALIGLVLGIIGLFQKTRRRTFAGIGVGINALGALIVAVLIAIGISVE